MAEAKEAGMVAVEMVEVKGVGMAVASAEGMEAVLEA